MIVAERDTNCAGLVAELLIGRRLACSAAHQGALEMKSAVAFHQIVGCFAQEPRRFRIEHGTFVSDADDYASSHFYRRQFTAGL